MSVMQPYRQLVPRLAVALRRCEATEVLDLCSGAGGPWGDVLPALRAQGCDVTVRLSDKFPNVAGFERAGQRATGIQGTTESVDATDVPQNLRGFRTLFTGLHHFPPQVAQAVLAAAVRDKRGIAVFEMTHRSLWSVVLMLLTPLAVWLLTPWIRPFRWSRLFWTYVIPVIPFIILFDGIVSCFRTYSPEELRTLVADIKAPHYRWDIGVEHYPAVRVPITYLIGVPADEAA